MIEIKKLREQFQSGEQTPVTFLEKLFSQIDERDNDTQGYLSVDKEKALEQASKADLSLPLGGVPIAIKDLINVEGDSCSCSSKMLEGKYISPYDATVIKKLKSLGAIPVGRTNMDEFAMGSSTENSAIQKTKNPWSKNRIPGGSSGGSAAVVADGTAVASLGSDTGGSIRQPAAHCGCVGLKPTYGRVSRFGLVAFASSLDQIGPMTRTVEDSAILLNALAGRDSMDSTTLPVPEEDFTASIDKDLTGMKIGLPKEFFQSGMDSDVQSGVEKAIADIEAMGAEPVSVSLPHTEYAVACYYIIATAEASSNLARFDAVRYGHRTEKDVDLIDQYIESRSEGFGDEVKRRILLGTYVLSSGYYDAYYLKAQKVRTLIRKDFEEAFQKVDAIVGPVTPTPAFSIGENIDDPMKMYLADIFTISTNLAGICGLSVPCGFVERDNESLPIGLQILGPALGESKILNIAHRYEQSNVWYKKTPIRA